MPIYAGTAKGLFTFEDASENSPLKIDFEGQSVYSIGVSDDRVWVSPFTEWTGHSIAFSENRGKSWETLEKPLKFPAGCEASVSKVWQIQTAPAGGDLLLGVEPAALFKLHVESGEWEFCEGLWNNPHREKWEPGFGGLCLNSIIPITESVWVVGISTGGVYRTEDSGKTWAASNSFIKTPFLAEEIPEFGQCVHKIAHHPSDPDVLYLQHHWGVYKSADAGKSWHNISEGKDLPTDFGFVCVTNKPGTAYIIPVHSDQFRCFPDGRLAVYKTDDAGLTWQPKTSGLPQQNAYDCVLRDSFHADDEKMAFGTTGGSLYFSDDGDNWRTIASHLPRITCVRVSM